MEKIMSKIIQKVRRLYKNKDRKLLEKHGIVDSDSPVGTDENGFFMEELTEEGEELLTQHLWTKYREEIVEIIRRVDASDKRREKKEDKD